MTWTRAHYPEALARLEEDIRSKAIAMANSLAAQGFADDEAVRIAIGRVEMWKSHRAKLEAGHQGPASSRQPLPTAPPNPQETPRASPPVPPRNSLPPRRR